jgi:hypothetical protein
MAITKLNNKAVANITTLPVALGDMVLVSSATASGSANIEFTLGNYKEYQFYFVNMHGSITEKDFSFQFSTDNGSTYGVTITSTMFRALHDEADTDTSLGYTVAYDLAQSTSFQVFSGDIKADADSSMSGSLTLFNPSSSSYVKHFIGNNNAVWYADYSIQTFVAGYANSVSPLTNIKFQMDSGNIDSGKILMFGIN